MRALLIWCRLSFPILITLHNDLIDRACWGKRFLVTRLFIVFWGYIINLQVCDQLVFLRGLLGRAKFYMLCELPFEDLRLSRVCLVHRQVSNIERDTFHQASILAAHCNAPRNHIWRDRAEPRWRSLLALPKRLLSLFFRNLLELFKLLSFAFKARFDFLHAHEVPLQAGLPQVKQVFEHAHYLVSFASTHPDLIDLIELILAFGHRAQVLQHYIKVKWQLLGTIVLAIVSHSRITYFLNLLLEKILRLPTLAEAFELVEV